MRISDWSSDVCSSDLLFVRKRHGKAGDPDTGASWRRPGSDCCCDGAGAASLRRPRSSSCCRRADDVGAHGYALAAVGRDPAGLAKMADAAATASARSEEHTSELQSLMRISYAVFCLKKKNTTTTHKK